MAAELDKYHTGKDIIGINELFETDPILDAALRFDYTNLYVAGFLFVAVALIAIAIATKSGKASKSDDSIPSILGDIRTIIESSENDPVCQAQAKLKFFLSDCRGNSIDMDVELERILLDLKNAYDEQEEKKT